MTIDITLDNDLQAEANRILRAWFRSGSDGPTGAIASIDNDTGAIRVLASGVDYGDDLEAGQRPYDLASYGERQPGSAFKPFVYCTALAEGISPKKTGPAGPILVWRVEDRCRRPGHGPRGPGRRAGQPVEPGRAGRGRVGDPLLRGARLLGLWHAVALQLVPWEGG